MYISSNKTYVYYYSNNGEQVTKEQNVASVVELPKTKLCIRYSIIRITIRANSFIYNSSKQLVDK